jgi:hypothetical protein
MGWDGEIDRVACGRKDGYVKSTHLDLFFFSDVYV